MSKLLIIQPCLFCGGTLRVQWELHVERKEFSVHCASCGARGPGRECKSCAIEAWNRGLGRPPGLLSSDVQTSVAADPDPERRRWWYRRKAGS